MSNTFYISLYKSILNNVVFHFGLLELGTKFTEPVCKNTITESKNRLFLVNN